MTEVSSRAAGEGAALGTWAALGEASAPIDSRRSHAEITCFTGAASRFRRRAPSIQVYPHSDPDCPRLRGGHRILMGPVVRIGTECSIAVEGIDGEKSGRGVLLVQHVHQVCKD